MNLWFPKRQRCLHFGRASGIHNLIIFQDWICISKFFPLFYIPCFSSVVLKWGVCWKVSAMFFSMTINLQKCLHVKMILPATNPRKHWPAVRKIRYKNGRKPYVSAQIRSCIYKPTRLSSDSSNVPGIYPRNQLSLQEYSDTSANEDNSFRNHIR